MPASVSIEQAGIGSGWIWANENEVEPNVNTFFNNKYISTWDDSDLGEAGRGEGDKGDGNGEETC